MKEQERLPEVRLRAMEPSDIEYLYYMENDRSIWNVGVTNVPYSRHLLAAYIENASGDIYTDKQVRLMVENASGQLVGIVDLINFSPEHRRAELGIVIQNDFRRLGYASSVLREIIDYGKKVLRLHQIYAIVSSDNVKCAMMMERVGFQKNMKLKDWLFDGESYVDADVFQIFL